MVSLAPELLSDVIGSIYDVVHDPLAWPSAIAKTRDLFHGSRACLARVGPDITPYDSVSDVNDPYFLKKMIEESLHQETVYVDNLAETPLGLVYHDHALVGGDLLRRSRLWNEWMVPQDMYGGLGVKVLASRDSFWFFDVQRGRKQPALDANDAALLKLLVPHLMRAVDISRKMSPLSVAFSGLSDFTFGVALVDSSMRIVSMNEAAERMMTRPDFPVRVRQGHLWVALPRRFAELRRLVAGACNVCDEVIPGCGGDMTFRTMGDDSACLGQLVNVLPARNIFELDILQQRYATVLLRDLTLSAPDNFDQQLRVLFDLTPSESRLAAALSAGLTLKDAAAQQDIRFSTARSYLEKIFAKTHVRQQSQLVALLKSVQPLVLPTR